MKTSKEELAFLMDFPGSEVRDVPKETWERFAVPLCRYVDEITFPINYKTKAREPR